MQHTGSVVVLHRLSCPAACGIFLGQGSAPYPLHLLADLYPLCNCFKIFCKNRSFFSFGMYIFLAFEFFNLFKMFPLKDNCFIQFCCFLSNMNKNQPYVHPCALPSEPTSHVSPHPTFLHCYSAMYFSAVQHCQSAISVEAV